MLKMSLGLVSGAALIMMLTYGCSSDTTNNVTPATDGGGGTTDAKKDSTTSGGDADPGDVCAPGKVDGFEPTWKTPSGFSQGKCSNAQVEAIIGCSFDDTADPTTCDKVAKDTANKDCEKCLFTSSTASKLGPVIITGNIGRLNLAGCIALSEGDTTDKSCGAKYQAASQCGDEACDANCPGDDEAALKAKQNCVTKALSGVCKDFATEAECAEALLDTGGAAEKCNEGSSFLDAAINLGKLFCGGAAATDGGTDSSVTDAAADG